MAGQNKVEIEASGIPGASLVEYARIPIAFKVEAVFDVGGNPGGGGCTLTERRVQTPYIKDYDTIGESPAEWVGRFDTSNWVLMTGRVSGQCIGGVTVAWRKRGLDMLEGRWDLAVLWDLRVAPEWRRHGVGAALLEAAERWARSKDCVQLKVETQNVNVAACRFYSRHGFLLRAAHPDAYPECPDEVQLLWYKDIDQRAGQ